jgi:peptidoglycan/LPS O-acetylase OafA/YrhL
MSHAPVSRSALIDCTKGLACVAIVWHHLAFYGPMSETVSRVAPSVIDWLYDYARMAVQVFLVMGGYLAAASLAPQGHARFSDPWSKIGRRFVRLVVPYAVALLLTMVVTAIVRPWYDHESLSADPDLMQLLAHALLLQNIVGEESLSAGVWYVSIDFQLYVLTTLLLIGVQSVGMWWRTHHPVQGGAVWGQSVVRGSQLVVVLGVMASLWGFNRDDSWDVWAVYFFGAYGLGMLAFWAVHARTVRSAQAWTWLIVTVVVVALLLEWRTRIAVAGVSALLMVMALRTSTVAQWQGAHALQRLGAVSYSVFLVHFAVCVAVNAVVFNLWPHSVAAAALGMFAAFGLSLVAGYWLYELVERRVTSWHVALRWQVGMIGTGLLTAMLAGMR